MTIDAKVKQVQSEQAPKAIGPYSHALILSPHTELVFLSGQVGIDPKSGGLIADDTLSQTKQALTNLKSLLLAAGSDLSKVVRVDIFLASLDDFPLVNSEYEAWFSSNPKPVRQTVEVSRLPLRAKIEISCIAYRGETG